MFDPICLALCGGSSGGVPVIHLESNVNEERELSTNEIAQFESAWKSGSKVVFLAFDENLFVLPALRLIEGEDRFFSGSYSAFDKTISVFLIFTEGGYFGWSEVTS
jgi:hypothetical protein